MKMPNFASLYHSGTSYLSKDSQSGRNGPSRPARSTSFKRAARGSSYFAPAFCQAWSISFGSLAAVGALEDAAACASDFEGMAAKTPDKHKVITQRIEHAFSTEITFLPTLPRNRSILIFDLVKLFTRTADLLT